MGLEAACACGKAWRVSTGHKWEAGEGGKRREKWRPPCVPIYTHVTTQVTLDMPATFSLFIDSFFHSYSSSHGLLPPSIHSHETLCTPIQSDTGGGFTTA